VNLRRRPTRRTSAGGAARGRDRQHADPSDGSGADLVPEAAQFAVHAPEAPSRVLGVEPDEEVADLLRQGWASHRRRLRPLLVYQALVPGQQGAWRDDPVPAKCAGEQSGQGGEQRPVRPARLGRGELPAQNRELVPQDQYLRILGRRGTSQRDQPCEDPCGDQVDKAYQHEG
jgi:hypothetical protein